MNGGAFVKDINSAAGTFTFKEGTAAYRTARIVNEYGAAFGIRFAVRKFAVYDRAVGIVHVNGAAVAPGIAVEKLAVFNKAAFVIYINGAAVSGDRRRRKRSVKTRAVYNAVAAVYVDSAAVSRPLVARAIKTDFVKKQIDIVLCELESAVLTEDKVVVSSEIYGA